MSKSEQPLVRNESPFLQDRASGVLRRASDRKPVCAQCGKVLPPPPPHRRERDGLEAVYGDSLAGGFFCKQGCAVTWAVQEMAAKGFKPARTRTEKPIS